MRTSRSCSGYGGMSEKMDNANFSSIHQNMTTNIWENAVEQNKNISIIREVILSQCGINQNIRSDI